MYCRTSGSSGSSGSGGGGGGEGAWRRSIKFLGWKEGENFSKLCSWGGRVSTLALILEGETKYSKSPFGWSKFEPSAGLVLLRKGSQCFVGPVFTPSEPTSYMCNYSQKEMGVVMNNCRRISS